MCVCGGGGLYICIIFTKDKSKLLATMMSECLLCFSKPDILE